VGSRKTYIRLCQEALGAMQSVSLERHGQRNNKNSNNQTCEGSKLIIV